jgi:hypothetical protein
MARDALAHAGSFDLDRLLPFARTVVAQEWPRILLIADALLRYRQLRYDDLRRLIG